jgi:hypothetical protein
MDFSFRLGGVNDPVPQKVSAMVLSFWQRCPNPLPGMDRERLSLVAVCKNAMKV